MPIYSDKEVLKMKLSSIPVSQLREFASEYRNIDNSGTGADIIKQLINTAISESAVNRFIKDKFLECIQERQNLISDEDLKEELKNVKDFSWGVVQGQLDQKIQSEYVRKYVKYNELIHNIKLQLHSDVTNYVICSWFNHWSTVLIEEHISNHINVIPTLKNIKGVDIFFKGQPFDLKITYLPRNYDPTSAMENPQDLAIWLYENQGAQRFGSDNRLFVVLFNRDDVSASWALKREFELIFNKIDSFFNKENVTKEDEVVFNFDKTTYTAVTKVLFITNRD